MRVFAGPNGSGKSTIIKSIRRHKVNGVPVDFGIYINADDLYVQLKSQAVDFKQFEIEASKKAFQEISLRSGLINKGFPEKTFKASHRIKNNQITLLNPEYGERLAQILAHFLRVTLLEAKKKFSFETVFSHSSKIDIMKEAKAMGCKVYLYFVSTEDPEINVFRVKEVRVAKGGHNVPEDKIRKRYFKSLELLYEATKIAYQVYFFDNSNEKHLQFAHFKRTASKENWDPFEVKDLPEWFLKYYAIKRVKEEGQPKL